MMKNVQSSRGIMASFKQSTHRKCFIDKKIKENTYPTAASLSRDYQAEYGARIDPRTIAEDIAEMRRELKAPIHYDSEKRGYVYTDPAYQADILRGIDIPIADLGVAGLAALGIQKSILSLLPATGLLSVWHKDILKTVFDKMTPPGRSREPNGDVTETQGPDLGKISVVEQRTSFSTPSVEQAVKEALSKNGEFHISYISGDGPPDDFLFHPFQLIYLKQDAKDGPDDIRCFLLGMLPQDTEMPYRILDTLHLQTVTLTDVTFQPPKNIHVKAIDPNSIEVMLCREQKDTILVFTAHEGTGEYRLLSRIDMYAK
jgi:hypothetical protein